MPAAAPAAPPADANEVPESVWMFDRLPASARVADRMLGTCRAAGCAPLADRRPQRLTAQRRTSAPRRSSW